MRGKCYGFSVFLDERKIKNVRVFWFSKMRGKQRRLGFSFKVQCPWEIKQFVYFSVPVECRVGDSFFFLAFSDMETDLEDKEGHIRYKNPIQYKMHKDLIIFHINIRFLKLEKLEFENLYYFGINRSKHKYPKSNGFKNHYKIKI